ncbi:glycosyltransferase family 2 protein [Methanobacterium alcaliphilum]|uniref:glycosyltransferase family 2 protein n=1 Tax=Methanobacterium alcaliphilum TaxID=392018 RepID=UPI00200B77CE|nr:glycosyltransferase family 2 protein [Methanobacterium alcaliphilum]MCK9150787.1 glycosyltransferase family 2 protein [Methanobacterium alcaliphilum]
MSLINDISVVIVTYNHRDYIENCLNSLDLNNLEVIVVDNGSTDGTLELVHDNFPQIKLIVPEENLGYGMGNNRGVQHCHRQFLVILNPDTKVFKDSLEKLVQPLTQESNIVTTPKILFYDGGDVNTCGNILHFTGLAFTRGLGESSDLHVENEKINAISGACFAMKRKDYDKIGGFDSNFLVYMEDVEFSWRAGSMGYSIYLITDSKICHDYQLNVSPEKIYHLEKGRYIILRKYFNIKERIIILPSLLLSEILSTGYAVLNGVSGIKYKIKGSRDGLNAEVERLGCGDISLDSEVPVEQLSLNVFDKAMRKIFNVIYRINYKFLKRFG